MKSNWTPLNPHEFPSSKAPGYVVVRRHVVARLRPTVPKPSDVGFDVANSFAPPLRGAERAERPQLINGRNLLGRWIICIWFLMVSEIGWAKPMDFYKTWSNFMDDWVPPWHHYFGNLDTTWKGDGKIWIAVFIIIYTYGKWSVLTFR